MQKRWIVRATVLAVVAATTPFPSVPWVVSIVGRQASWAVEAAPDGGGDPVLVGAGDIAFCGSSGSEATAKLLDRLPGTVFTAGDDTEDKGTEAEYANCYNPTWGRHKARTRPTPGNHDYDTPGAAPYYRYFGSAAGDPAKGYYSYNLGAWHVVAINSNCGEVGGCEAGSPQEQWLRADLAAAGAKCTVAYWHQPRFFSPTIGDGRVPAPSSDKKMTAIWRALQAGGGDVVVSGHRQVYERFARMNATGDADPTGIREFIVGTGGDALDRFDQRHLAPHSEARLEGVYGVIKFTLHSDGYDWEFLADDGAVRDSGSDTCLTGNNPGSGATPTTTSADTNPSPGR